MREVTAGSRGLGALRHRPSALHMAFGIGAEMAWALLVIGIGAVVAWLMSP